MKIRIDIKSNSNSNFHSEFIMQITDKDYNILKDYEIDGYDEAWDRLCDKIEHEAIPEALDPDWYIDHINFN